MVKIKNKFTFNKINYATNFRLNVALAVVAGLLGAVLGSAHPIAAALVSAIAGALIAGVTMAICIVTMPDHVFGVGERTYLQISRIIFSVTLT